MDSPAPAVALFLARARAADPDFDPAPDELADIAAICAGCDGLPLAVELAAARTRVLTVAELRDRIGHPLPVLEAGPRDAPARHRTLRASIAWSVEALDPADQQFLAGLSVFRGGFTLAAAAAVTETHVDQAMERLDSLLGRSLVHRRATAGGHAASTCWRPSGSTSANGSTRADLTERSDATRSSTTA